MYTGSVQYKIKIWASSLTQPISPSCLSNTKLLHLQPYIFSENIPCTIFYDTIIKSDPASVIRRRGSLSVEVDENINFGYSQEDQGYS